MLKRADPYLAKPFLQMQLTQRPWLGRLPWISLPQGVLRQGGGSLRVSMKMWQKNLEEREKGKTGKRQQRWILPSDLGLKIPALQNSKTANLCRSESIVINCYSSSMETSTGDITHIHPITFTLQLMQIWKYQNLNWNLCLKFSPTIPVGPLNRPLILTIYILSRIYLLC